MRSFEVGRVGRWMVWMMLVLVPVEAEAQRLRAVAEVQYDNLDRFGAAENTEWWLTSYRLDYATRLRQTLELSSQLQYNEQWYVDRPDRTRTPLGSLRLAHQNFGFFASYRPTTVTDSKSFTTQQQETMLTGYLQQAGLPRLVASWVRRHLDPTVGTPGSESVMRDLRAFHTVGRFDLRAAYGDQSRVADNAPDRKAMNDHFDFGTSTRLEGRRVNGTFNYDFTESRRRGAHVLHNVSRVHSLGLGGSASLSTRTTASLTYSFRHTGTGTRGVSTIREHDGALNLAHQLNKVVQFSTGGGVRSADVGGRKEIESFVLGSATASGTARPGWLLSSGLSHSWNWLPGDRARPVENLSATSRMRLATGLDLNTDLGMSRTERALLPVDTLTSPVQYSLQAGAGLRAVPLRTVVLTGTARRYRVGATLRGEDVSTNSVTSGIEWRPSARLTATTTWSTTRGFTFGAPAHTLMQSMVQWTPSRAFQVTGTYAHSDQQVRDVNTALSANRETYGGWLVWALTRDLRATIRYSEADRGLRTHARQVNATVTQGFGR